MFGLVQLRVLACMYIFTITSYICSFDVEGRCCRVLTGSYVRSLIA